MMFYLLETAQLVLQGIVLGAVLVSRRSSPPPERPATSAFTPGPVKRGRKPRTGSAGGGDPEGPPLPL